ncbi:hypothetical protein [Streptomyces sp. NPDC088180]|uniref:hypothetical protein n=1 Tax=Streptomyces sp. NPDC088180 TaxID=3365837 RepID=UPI0038054BDF
MGRRNPTPSQHSVREADRIYVLDEGRVVEHGTFAELMDPATGTGAFRDAYELQARQFRTPTVPGQPGASGTGVRTEGTAAT